jgi:hypothetical protein
LVRVAVRFFSGVPHPHLLGVCCPNPFQKSGQCPLTGNATLRTFALPLSGGVAQLVRALPCHGRGYGFEPRHSRHFFFSFTQFIFLSPGAIILYVSDSMDVTNLSPAQLRRAAELKERIDSLTSELARMLGGAVSLNPQPLPPKSGGRRMSAAGRARIAAAARARWAKVRAGKGGGAAAAKSAGKVGRRKMSPAARAKIAAAARARWAKAKAAGKSRL